MNDVLQLLGWESLGLYVYSMQPHGQFLLSQASVPYTLIAQSGWPIAYSARSLQVLMLQ